MYFFLCHLSFLNGFISTVVTPKMLVNSLASSKVLSYALCLTQTYLTLCLESTECSLLAVMAIDKYMAICYPLRYLLITSWTVCPALALAVWVTSFFVDYLFCALPILLHMFCADASLLEAMVAIRGARTVLCPFLLIVLSYLCILVAMIRIDSVEGRERPFQTGLIRFLRPKSLYSAEREKLISVFYAVIDPALNPFIYSLRNKEVQRALRRLIDKKKKKKKKSPRIPF
ncbi:Olfactory receptor 2A12 [Lemmus lemmus]